MIELRLGARRHGEEIVGGTLIHIEANAGNLDALEGRMGCPCSNIFKWIEKPGERFGNLCAALSCLCREGKTPEDIRELLRPADRTACVLAIGAEIKEAFSHEETLGDENGEVDVGLMEADAKKTEP